MNENRKAVSRFVGIGNEVGSFGERPLSCPNSIRIIIAVMTQKPKHKQFARIVDNRLGNRNFFH